MELQKLMILMILIIVIIILLMIHFSPTGGKITSKCPTQTCDNKYLPRSFKDEQNKPVLIYEIFNKMFSNPSPLMMSKGIGVNDRREIGLKTKK